MKLSCFVLRPGRNLIVNDDGSGGNTKIMRTPSNCRLKALENLGKSYLQGEPVIKNQKLPGTPLSKIQ